MTLEERIKALTTAPPGQYRIIGYTSEGEYFWINDHKCWPSVRFIVQEQNGKRSPEADHYLVFNDQAQRLW